MMGFTNADKVHRNAAQFRKHRGPAGGAKTKEVPKISILSQQLSAMEAAVFRWTFIIDAGHRVQYYCCLRITENSVCI